MFPNTIQKDAEAVQQILAQLTDEEFMNLSIKERGDYARENALRYRRLNEEEKEKFLQLFTNKQQELLLNVANSLYSRLPTESDTKHWTGEKGDSNLVIDSNHIHNGKTVGEWCELHRVKEPLTIRYKNGEPQFISVEKTKVNYDASWDYSKIKPIHDQAIENFANEPSLQGRLDPNAINPVRDFTENTATDGTRVEGCRKTYHEERDLTTVSMVPDFIHQLASHTGGRSLAQLVQTF